MEDGVLRKEFNYIIKIWKISKVRLYFKQASIQEILEFEYATSKKDFNLSLWICNFCENHLKNKGFLSLLWFERHYISDNAEKIFSSLKETYFKWFFTQSSDWVIPEWRPFSSYLLNICKSFHCDPDFLIKNYTREQLHSEEWYVGWLIWNNNEGSENGRKKNKLKSMKHDVWNDEVKRRVEKFLKSNKQ